MTLKHGPANRLWNPAKEHPRDTFDQLLALMKRRLQQQRDWILAQLNVRIEDDDQ